MTSPFAREDGAGFDAAKLFEVARQVGHGRALGMEFRGSGDNWTELALPWREQLVGVPATGVLASRAIVSLVDTASGMSVWVTLDDFMPGVTLDLRLDDLRPAVKGETIHARCECTKLTRRIAFVSGVTHGGDPQRPIARSAGTFMLHRKDAA